MKVTKRQLKQIIKEEIEATMQEQGGDEMAQAEELAQALSQSPAMMDFVNKARQDPEVQAAVKAAQAEMQGGMQERMNDVADAGVLPGVAGLGVGAAVGHAIIMGKIGMIGAGAAGAAATIGLPVAAGLMATALGLMIYKSFQRDYPQY